MVECTATCGVACCGAANFILSTLWTFALSFLAALAALLSLIGTAAAAYGAWWTYNKAMDTWKWLLGRIDTLESGLKKEIADRLTAEGIIKTLITKEHDEHTLNETNIKNTIADEHKEHTLNETNIKNTIAEEHKEHTLNEDNIKKTLDKERSDRLDDETRIDNRIDSEHKEHTLREGAIEQEINSERAAREAGDRRLGQTKQDKGAPAVQLPGDGGRGGNRNPGGTVTQDSNPELFNQLKRLGNCQFGYTWHRDETHANGPGWTCEKGGHHITDAALEWYKTN
ncbi:hypothetical protein TWF281_005308 [Arthrobotrys megalospora]